MTKPRKRDYLDGLVKPRGGQQQERPKAAAIVQPTDEQMARGDFRREQIIVEGLRVGLAYRRRPLVESLADKIGLGAPELAALRYYRTAFERADASPTKSCLDVGVGGGGGNGSEGRMLGAIERALASKAAVQRCERAIGAVVNTVREVAVFDRSFSDVAIDRFGGREQSWIVGKESRTKIVPRSGRHRQRVADEFLQGMRALVRMLSGFRKIDGPGEIAAPAPRSQERGTLSSAIFDALMRNPGTAALWMAETTMMDIERERGVASLAGDNADEFAGVPIVVRDSWAWGWMLVAGE